MKMNLRHLAAALLAAGFLGSAGAESVRPEVGKPLAQASELLRAGKAKEALAKVREADAVAGKTPAEQYMIDRVRGSAAQRAGDNATAAQAFESAFASGKVPASEQGQVAESLAFAYSQQQNWAKSNQWVQKAQSLGNNSAGLKQLAAYLQQQNGDYSAVARDSQAAVSAAEQAGRRPAEDDLLRLQDAYRRTGNKAGEAAALEKLLANYPKKEYWNIYLGRLQSKPGFSDRFLLDLLRLRLATGSLTKADDVMEMAQLCLQAGLTTEAKAVLDKGFAAGQLGTGAGPEVDRQKRLRELALKSDADAHASLERRTQEAVAARDGNALIAIGAETAGQGQAEKGAALIEQGIAKGGLKRPEDAKLRLGNALLQSPKSKSRGQQVLRSVQGNDGAADIARLSSVLGAQ